MSPQGSGPRWGLAALLALSASLHVIGSLRAWPSVVGVVLAVVALGALAVAFVVPVRARQSDLLAAIVVGAVGVASFLVPTLVGLVGGSSPTVVLDLWSVGGFLVDTVVVRLAAIVLRREARATGTLGRRSD